MSTYITATKARKNFFQLMEKTARSTQPVSITHRGIPKVIMISQEEFEGLIETMEIMSDAQLMKDLREAEKETGGISLEELEKELHIKAHVSRHSKTKGSKAVSKAARRRATKNRSRISKAAR